MRTNDFDYRLPDELIAQTPVEPRDHSRLLVLYRDTGLIEHRRFDDLPEFLRAGDVMVFNDSRVFPARLYGRRTDTGGQVELLMLHRLGPTVWKALVKPGPRMRIGARFEVSGAEGVAIFGEVVEVEPDGSRVIRLSDEHPVHQLGVIPLPPYIREPLADEERYQTVYSRVLGSVAAPTAGLHFTESLLDLVRDAGVETVFVTLHVGSDSFRPVQHEDPRLHKLNSEHWELTATAAETITRAKKERRRVISIGTTAVRLLEHAAMLGGDFLEAGSGWADLMILPGHNFQVVDALVTNFHLPRSTLLMLTSAFVGSDLLLNAYSDAIDHRYRFYSFGDAMLAL